MGRDFFSYGFRGGYGDKRPSETEIDIRDRQKKATQSTCIKCGELFTRKHSRQLICHDCHKD